MTSHNLTWADAPRAGIGKATYVPIPVGETASGVTLEIGMHVLEGSKPGPKLGIVSTHHGDELFTAELTRRLVAATNPAELSGTIFAVPVANPLAFEWGTRHTPQDMTNMNRVFPGNDAGWITETMARALTDAIVPQIDHLIDLHCGATDTTIHYTYTRKPDDDFSRRIHELALIAGAEVLWESAGPAGTLAGDAANRGVVTVIVEAGGGTSFGTPLEERSMRGLLNIMKKIGMLAGEPVVDPARAVVRTGTAPRPRQGGIFIPEIGLDQLGKQVPKGTLLGRVVSSKTMAEIDRVVAPYGKTEIMMVRDRISKVHPGDYAYIVGDGDSGYAL
jgi:predicted deacylase